MFKYALFTIITFLVAASVNCSSGKADKQYNKKNLYHYNMKTVKTLSGTVVEVGKIKKSYYPGNHKGIHLKLKTLHPKRTVYEVHLGPDWFVSKEMIFKIGDTIDVKGSLVQFENTPVIFAKKVMKGKKVLYLRQYNGIPLWLGKDSSYKHISK